jgi:hypothetical protein
MTPLSLPLGLTSVSRQRIGVEDKTCLVDGVCVSAEALTAAAAVVGTLAFAITIALALSRIKAAEDALESERKRTTSERDAFRSFVERVEAQPTATPRLTDGGRAKTGVHGGTELASVVDAYRDTFLDLDHYDAEYDDTLGEHMAAELGDDVAVAVGNSAVLTPQLKATLCRRAREASQHRERLLDALDAEGNSLANHGDVLVDVDDDLADAARTQSALDDPASDADFGALGAESRSGVDGSGVAGDDPPPDPDRAAVIAAWQRTEAAQRQLEAVLADRQRDIHAQRDIVDGDDGPATLYEYVYGGLPNTYPVLGVATTLLERATTLRGSLARSMHRT